MKRGTVRKFGRVRKVRTAFLRSLATSLITHGRITTTHARAKTLSAHADKLVTRAKTQSVTARRLLATQLGTAAVKKLVDDIAPKFADRKGGYTRIVRLPRRISDGSPMALVEFTA